MSIQKLAETIADAVHTAQTSYKAQRATYNDGNITVDGHVYPAELACPINLYSGKSVWVLISDDGKAVVVGD